MLGGEFVVGREDDVEKVGGGLIDGFEAVENRAAHEGDLALVLGDFFVRIDAPRGHGEVEFDDVAGLPAPLEMHVAVGRRRELALAMSGFW